MMAHPGAERQHDRDRGSIVQRAFGGLLVRAVIAKCLLAWFRDGDLRRRASALGELVVSKTELAGTGAHVGRRRLAGRGLVDLHLARPQLLARAWIVGDENLEYAIRSERGAVMATLHSDVMWLIIQIVSPRAPLSILVGPWFFDEGAAVGGPAHRAAIEAAGSEVVPIGEWRTTLIARLRSGRLCPVTLDVPGKYDVQLAGKRAVIQPGCAALARKADGYVIPVAGYFVGARPVIEFGTPIDPREYSDPRQLLHVIAAALDEPLRRHPHLWAPHTNELWPDDVQPYAWAFES
jgi:hypothetical protein